MGRNFRCIIFAISLALILGVIQLVSAEQRPFSVHIDPLPMIAEEGCLHSVHIKVDRLFTSVQPAFEREIMLNVDGLPSGVTIVNGTDSSALPLTFKKPPYSFSLKAVGNVLRPLKYGRYNVGLIVKPFLTQEEKEALKLLNLNEQDFMLKQMVPLLVLPQNADFNFRLSPTLLSVRRGESRKLWLSVSRAGCDKRDVVVSHSGLPIDVDTSRPFPDTFSPFDKLREYSLITKISSPLGNHTIEFIAEGETGLPFPFLVKTVKDKLTLTLLPNFIFYFSPTIITPAIDCWLPTVNVCADRGDDYKGKVDVTLLSPVPWVTGITVYPSQFSLDFNTLDIKTRCQEVIIKAVAPPAESNRMYTVTGYFRVQDQDLYLEEQKTLSVIPKEGDICDDECTDKALDDNNCGKCGYVCKLYEKCLNGRCVCPKEKTICNGTCSDLQTDKQNCGQCAYICPIGHECYNGSCVCKHKCSGTCVDLSSDPLNCGKCGEVCGLYGLGSGETKRLACINSECVCPETGKKICGGRCCSLNAIKCCSSAGNYQCGATCCDYSGRRVGYLACPADNPQCCGDYLCCPKNHKCYIDTDKTPENTCVWQEGYQIGGKDLCCLPR